MHISVLKYKTAIRWTKLLTFIQGHFGGAITFLQKALLLASRCCWYKTYGPPWISAKQFFSIIIIFPYLVPYGNQGIEHKWRKTCRPLRSATITESTIRYELNKGSDAPLYLTDAPKSSQTFAHYYEFALICSYFGVYLTLRYARYKCRFRW